MSSYKNSKSESETSLENSNNDSENACVVCFKNVDTYSVGECDHPVCYECSTRMRVLCRQNECPICRHDLQKVIFTTEVLPYRQLEIDYRTAPYEKRYRIIFGNTQIEKQFNDLLVHPCPKCEALTFPSFDTLKDHVRRTHELFYCELCTNNLKIFSFERRCYNREELSLHRRKGDIDNTSHRGHPLCKYCNCRYLGRDELFRHLRSEHYFCYFCDADGSNQFYDDYESLREHFKAEHYICEEGECIHEKFTSVFRSDIDLRAHIASTHGKYLGKVATKQARTLELEFTLAPRNSRSTHQNGSDGTRGAQTHSMRIRNDPQMEFEIEDRSSMYMQNPQKTIDHKNEAEFPSLGSGNGSTAVHLVRPNVSISAKSFRSTGFAKTKENFPALGGENSALDPGPSLASTFHTKNTASSILRQSSAPAPNNAASQLKSGGGGGGMVIHVSNRPTSTTQSPTTTISSKRNSDSSGKNLMNDFPALPGSHKNNRYLDFNESAPTPRIPINLNTASSKNRAPIPDDYVPLTTSIGTKFNLIRKDASTTALPSKQQRNLESSGKNIMNDFPALPDTHKSNRYVDSDEPSTPRIPINLNNVAAKHKSQVTDNYVPLNTSTGPKFNLNKKDTHTTALPSKRNSDSSSKNVINDFPTLSGSHKNNRYVDLDEPMTPRIPINLSGVAAKHKSLVTDSFVPSTTSVGTKLNMIRNDATSSEVLGQPSPNKKPMNTGAIVNPPKLNSNENFPELSTPSNSSGNTGNILLQQPQWNVKQKTEPKRLKVAAAPILHDNNGTNGMTTNVSNKVGQTNKNDRKKKQMKLIDSSVIQGNTTLKNNKPGSKESTNNNINKKFSDLNIVTDFPSLDGGGSSKPAPPPGFENKTGSKGEVPPPPGFNKVILNSVARPNQNNLTFTTSLGECFNIMPAHKYRPPPNAGKRNDILIMNFHQVLKSDVMNEFRQISQLFKDGIYNTEPYYDHCKSALSEHFDEIFPELLALLPDISKQQELYLVHTQKLKEAFKNKKNRSQFKVPKLEVCSTCKQVLVSNDLLAHIQNHEMENNFPSLSNKNTSSS